MRIEFIIIEDAIYQLQQALKEVDSTLVKADIHEVVEKCQAILENYRTTAARLNGEVAE